MKNITLNMPDGSPLPPKPQNVPLVIAIHTPLPPEPQDTCLKMSINNAPHPEKKSLCLGMPTDNSSLPQVKNASNLLNITSDNGDFILSVTLMDHELPASEKAGKASEGNPSPEMIPTPSKEPERGFEHGIPPLEKSLQEGPEEHPTDLVEALEASGRPLRPCSVYDDGRHAFCSRCRGMKNSIPTMTEKRERANVILKCLSAIVKYDRHRLESEISEDVKRSTKPILRGPSEPTIKDVTKAPESCSHEGLTDHMTTLAIEPIEKTHVEGYNIVSRHDTDPGNASVLLCAQSPSNSTSRQFDRRQDEQMKVIISQDVNDETTTIQHDIDYIPCSMQSLVDIMPRDSELHQRLEEPGNDEPESLGGSKSNLFPVSGELQGAETWDRNAQSSVNESEHVNRQNKEDAEAPQSRIGGAPHSVELNPVIFEPLSSAQPSIEHLEDKCAAFALPTAEPNPTPSLVFFPETAEPEGIDAKTRNLSAVEPQAIAPIDAPRDDFKNMAALRGKIADQTKLDTKAMGTSPDDTAPQGKLKGPDAGTHPQNNYKKSSDSGPGLASSRNPSVRSKNELTLGTTEENLTPKQLHYKKFLERKKEAKLIRRKQLEQSTRYEKCKKQPLQIQERPIETKAITLAVDAKVEKVPRARHIKANSDESRFRARKFQEVHQILSKNANTNPIDTGTNINEIPRVKADGSTHHGFDKVWSGKSGREASQPVIPAVPRTATTAAVVQGAPGALHRDKDEGHASINASSQQQEPGDSAVSCNQVNPKPGNVVDNHIVLGHDYIQGGRQVRDAEEKVGNSKEQTRALNLTISSSVDGSETSSEMNMTGREPGRKRRSWRKKRVAAGRLNASPNPNRMPKLQVQRDELASLSYPNLSLQPSIPPYSSTSINPHTRRTLNDHSSLNKPHTPALATFNRAVGEPLYTMNVEGPGRVLRGGRGRSPGRNTLGHHSTSDKAIPDWKVDNHMMGKRQRQGFQPSERQRQGSVSTATGPTHSLQELHDPNPANASHGESMKVATPACTVQPGTPAGFQPGRKAVDDSNIAKPVTNGPAPELPCANQNSKMRNNRMDRFGRNDRHDYANGNASMNATAHAQRNGNLENFTTGHGNDIAIGKGVSSEGTGPKSNLHNYPTATPTSNSGRLRECSSKLGRPKRRAPPFHHMEPTIVERPYGNWDSSDSFAQPDNSNRSSYRITLAKLPKHKVLKEAIQHVTQIHPLPSQARTPEASIVSCNPVARITPPHLRIPEITPSVAPAGPSEKANIFEKPKVVPRQENGLWLPPHLRVPVAVPVPRPSVTQTLLKAKVDPTGKAGEAGSRPLADINGSNNVTSIQQAPKSNQSAMKETGSGPLPEKVEPATPEPEITPTPSKGKERATAEDESTPTPLIINSNISVGSKVSIVNAKPIKKQSLEFEHPLAGWDGEWSPAPVEWGGRPSFNNSDAHHIRSIDAWLEERAGEALNNPVALNTKDPGFETGQALATGAAVLLKPIDSKDHETILPDDDFTKAKFHETAADAAKKHRTKVKVDRKETKAERRAYREGMRARITDFVPPPNPHEPEANIYVRPAEARDLSQVAEIYNHYIEHSVVAAEREKLNDHQWRGRWIDATESNYAFLVAVQLSARGGGYNRRTSHETICGFAYADDFGDNTNAYRYTCELQVYVGNWTLRMGIGKSLVDRMIAALDPHYTARCGVKFNGGAEPIRYEQGGVRVIRNIVINILYPAKDESTLKWQKEWLAQWHFEHAGTLPGVGRKFDKVLNLAMLIKETGSVLPSRV